jgi:hypothetical protein
MITVSYGGYQIHGVFIGADGNFHAMVTCEDPEGLNPWLKSIDVSRAVAARLIRELCDKHKLAQYGYLRTKFGDHVADLVSADFYVVLEGEGERGDVVASMRCDENCAVEVARRLGYECVRLIKPDGSSLIIT